MPTTNGEVPSAPLELNEILQVGTKDGVPRPYKVVGILEDEEDGETYAVLEHEPDPGGEREFIVTDLDGNLVEDGVLAEEILEDFMAIAQHGHDGGTPA